MIKRATQRAYDLGQSLWLDNISRTMLADGLLQRYIDEFHVTGVTSNPTIFERAITSSGAYDEQIRCLLLDGSLDDRLLFELFLSDLRKAADMLSSHYERTNGSDGFVSLEVSPFLADDSEKSVAAAKCLHERSGRPNLLIKIPGTSAGATAIEESIRVGVPVNVTLLFSVQQYVAAIEAYMSGLEMRLAAGLSINIASVASIFISRWDHAVQSSVPERLKNQLGLAIGQQAFRAYRESMESDRWQRLAARGAQPQRLLFASTGVKELGLPADYYAAALVAPNTINTLPDRTLRAMHDNSQLGEMLQVNGGDCGAIIEEHLRLGIDVQAMAAQLQRKGLEEFQNAWRRLLITVQAKGKALLGDAVVGP